MKKFLITRPEHDDTTYYLSKWSRACIEAAEEKGVAVCDLHKERANRKQIESMIAKQQPAFIMFNGHGNDVCVTGHQQQPLIKTGENEALLREKIIYALSCRSAKILGRKSVSAGAKAYLGYEDDFIFFYNKEMISRPTKDKIAALFLEPSNAIPLALLKGRSAGEAEQRAKELYMEQIRKMLSSESPTEDAAIVRYLWWDMKNLACHGDREATF